MPRALKCEITNERSDASKNNPLSVRQQIVAPIQCRPQRLMPGNRRSMGQFQQFQPSNGVLEAEGGHLTRGQLNCQGYAIQLSAHFRDKRRLLVGENEASRPRRHASCEQLHCWISKHGICRLLRAIWWKIKRRNPATMLALYFQQFATRGQKMDLLRFPGRVARQATRPSRSRAHSYRER